MACVCCSSPAPGSHWTTRRVEPALCLGRYEGTDKFLGRRALTASSLQSSLRRREHLKTCVVQPRGCVGIRKSSQNTRPFADCAKNPKAEKKQKNPLVGVVCLLTTGGLIRVRCYGVTPQAATPGQPRSASRY